MAWLGTHSVSCLSTWDAHAGPFRLGRWSGIFGLTSCAWIGLISVVFCLPTVYPVTRDNMNYSAVSIAATVSLALITW